MKDLIKGIEGIIKEKGVFFRNIKSGVCTYSFLSEGEYTPKALATSIAESIVVEWISVEDRLPESGQCVLINSKNGGVAEGAYLSAKGHFEQWRWNSIKKDVTHWQPLPEPPKDILKVVE